MVATFCAEKKANKRATRLHARTWSYLSHGEGHLAAYNGRGK